MSLKHLTMQHARIAKQALAVAGLALLLLPIPGCSTVAGSPTLTQIRIIDASPDAPGLDIYEGTNVLAYNLGFGSITSYVPIAPGIYTIAAHAASSATSLIGTKGTFAASNQYTVLFGNSVASLQETILTDQTQAAPSGYISLRFIDQSVAVGAFDIYMVPTGSKITAVKPIQTDISFGTNTGYITSVPTGTYTLVAIPTGVVPSSTTVADYTGTSVTYTGGSAMTIVFIDESVLTSPGLQVIMASDYTPAGFS
jgi:hypothetical protein